MPPDSRLKVTFTANAEKLTRRTKIIKHDIFELRLTKVGRSRSVKIDCGDQDNQPTGIF